MTWALLVIDRQMWPTNVESTAAKQVALHQQRLLDGFRVAGEPVFFIERAAEHVLLGGQPSANREMVYRCGSDAFSGTTLQRRLRDKRVNCVVICGVGTDTAIEASVRSALYLGFDVLVASDAHLAFDRPKLDAALITEHHNQLMAELVVAGQVIEVLPTQDILAILQDEPIAA